MQRSKKWFEGELEFIRLEIKKDPFPKERAAMASAAAADPQPNPVPPKTKSQKNTCWLNWFQSRRECDLNRLYDLEKKGRQGRCMYYQVHQTPLQWCVRPHMHGFVEGASSSCTLNVTVTTTVFDMV